MKTLDLNAQERAAKGKKDAADLRRADRVPCILYGGAEPVHFSADTKELKGLIYSPEVYFVNINLGDKVYRGAMKEIQFHPVTDAILHVDFLEISESKAIRMELPVRITGNSAGVRAGGKLVVNMRKLKVEALPKDMPDEISVDISNLNIGDVLRINQLTAPGVTFQDGQNLVVAAVRITRSARSAQAAEATGGK